MTVSAYLFDETEAQEDPTWTDSLSTLKKSQILWVDLEAPSEQEIEEAVEALGLEGGSRSRLLDYSERVRFDDFGEHIHLNASAAVYKKTLASIAIDCLVGNNWILTVHSEPVQVLDEFRNRVTGAGELGRLDAPSFLAALLEWVVSSYLRALEEVDKRLEQLDVRMMEAQEPEESLHGLVALRQDVGRLRRTLAPHRDVLIPFAHPELDAISSPESAERFKRVLVQHERALDVIGSAQEMVMGSFDVLIARSGQRTNEIMKILTLASITLLPSSLIAGILGMNFQVGLFDRANLFWVVVAGMLALGLGTLAAARLRRWI